MTDSAPDTHGLQDHERSTVTAAKRRPDLPWWLQLWLAVPVLMTLAAVVLEVVNAK